MKRKILLIFMMIALFSACQPTQPVSTPTSQSQPTETSVPKLVYEGTLLEPQGFVQRTHDPVIAHEGDTYYVYSTGSRIPFICSKDMANWEFCGRVFEKDPTWIRDVNPNLVDLWAPDISFFNGKWHLYYAASNFGNQNSAIGLATNVTLDPNKPDYKWVDQGIVLG